MAGFTSALASAVLMATNSTKSFTDLIVHEDTPVYVKYPGGTKVLHALIPEAPQVVVTRFEIQDYFAVFAAGVASGEEKLAFWTQTVDPAFRRMESVQRTLEMENGAFLRFSLFQYDGGKVGMVIRVTRAPRDDLDKSIPTALVEALDNNRKGMILLTGPTASGKTATALSFLRYLSLRHSGHIVSIEDPVEYKMSGGLGIFTQREVGRDVATFAQGLKEALRQSLDVLLVGEVRDKETAETSILAAESGALVILTTHGNTIGGAIRKLCYLAGDQSATAMRSVLAGGLIGAMRQQLIGMGEQYLLLSDFLDGSSDAIQSMIEEGRFEAIDALFAEIKSPHHISMNGEISKLIREGKITYKQGLTYTTHQQGLKSLWMDESKPGVQSRFGSSSSN